MERFVTRWDLDKTYLRTRFDTVSDLLNTALESVEDKRTVPGATAVLRELGAAGAVIHILSGSPRQMRRRLTEKLELDRIAFHELTLKPNLSNLLSLRFGALRDQLGYKLPELLEAHVRDARARAAGPDPRSPWPEVLVGDDSESDAFVYSLYADLCAGHVGEIELREILEAGGVRTQAVRRCLATLTRLPRADVVDVILIHLDAQSPPSLFLPYGSRVVPFFNYLQAAFVLLERGFLSARSVLRIAAQFQMEHGFTGDVISRSYADLRRRGHAVGSAPAALSRALEGEPGKAAPAADALELPGPRVSSLADAIHELERTSHSLSASTRAPSGTGASSLTPLSSPKPVPLPSKLDYRALAEHHRHGRNRRKPGQRFY